VPHWLGQAEDRLAHVKELPANWDSYGARPVSVAAIEAALRLLGEVMADDLPLPDIVPTVSGGIQVEWHIANIDFEIEVSAEGKRGIFFEDSLGTISPTENEALIPELVSAFRKRIIAHNQDTGM
jgi:hypothetical protein